METSRLIDSLNELIQVDIDTVHSYNRALDEISDHILRARIVEFRDAHQNHVANLLEEIQFLGGQAPKPAMDFKGHILEAFTALQTTTGMKGALKALKAAELISNSYYAKTIAWEVPAPVKKMLREHFSDEKNHLEYISNNLVFF